MTASSSSSQRWVPFLFVLLWSTGFIGAKFGLPYTAPFSYLAWRMLFVVLIMGSWALLSRAPWPSDSKQFFHIGMAGLLVHATYLGGVFVAISHGLPAGVTSLIVGLQPLLAATVAGRFLHEKVTSVQWLGLVLGLAGTALVVTAPMLSTHQSASEILAQLNGVPAAVVALLGITLGSLYQKRFCRPFDFRSGAAIQFLPTLLVCTTLAWALESKATEWTPRFMFGLAWLVLVLSIGAITLLNRLIRQGSAVNVASLFYLVPPFTAVIAWAMFDEKLTPMAMLGMAIAFFGVYLSRR